MKHKKQLDIETHLNNPIKEGKLNEVIVRETIRKNGSRRIQQDFEFCPTMAEQHTGHLTDINYLMEKYRPDELDAYLAARSQYRKEILGHDFSQEPSLQDGMNVVVQSRQAFDELPDDIKIHFKNHVEFLKFIDNPKNEEKMIKLGLLKKQDLEKLKIPDPAIQGAQTQTTTKEEDKAGDD